MKRLEVKAGDRFGDWTVIKEAETRITKGGEKRRMILCKCGCGEEMSVLLSNLNSGISTQCKACGNREKNEKRKIKADVGDKFNDWEVLREPETKPKKDGYSERIAYCRCTLCGYKGYVGLTKLHTGASKQCNKCGLKNSLSKYRINKGLDPDTPITESNKLERGVFSTVVRTRIYIRDNSECQMCSKPANAVHHIIPWSTCYKSEDQNLRYDPENCICLCKECHLKAHGGNCQQLDYEIAEQLLAKAIENTEKNFEYMKGLKEKALKKLAEIH